MKIRDYRPEDLDSILNLDGKYSERRKDKMLGIESNPGRYYCYVGEDNGRLAGFIIMEDLKAGDSASHYMVQINVSESEKRRGFGTLLVKRVFTRVREEASNTNSKKGRIVLNVNTDNEPAIRFYESLGFQRLNAKPIEYQLGKLKWFYGKNFD